MTGTCSATAISLKSNGLRLDALTAKYAKYAKEKFGAPFSRLSSTQKNQVFLEIVESAGRARPAVNASARHLSRLGRSLVVVSAALAVYKIVSAQDKVQAAAREGVVISGGFAGGAAGGALAGLSCGPGAPVCVTVGVFVGGALGALGAELSFGWIF